MAIFEWTLPPGIFWPRQGTIFNASKGKLTPAQYISSSFIEASHFAQVLDDDHIDRCFLTSVSVSLKKADYQKFLEDMKKRVMELVNCVMMNPLIKSFA